MAGAGIPGGRNLHGAAFHPSAGLPESMPPFDGRSVSIGSPGIMFPTFILAILLVPPPSFGSAESFS